MRVSGKQPFFDPRKYFYKIRSSTARADFKRQQVIYEQRDPAGSIFYILEGRVDLKLALQQRKQAIIPSLSIGDFFGEGCLVGESQRLTSAVAASSCSVVRIEKSAMITMLRDEPVFAARFIWLLINRNVPIAEALVDLLFSPSEKRLVRLLLLLANFGKDEMPEPVIANISQESLAEMLNTTRSRVNVAMNRLRKLGFIEYNDGLRIHSSLLNVILFD